MRSALHLNDFHLVQKCLEADEHAVAQLQQAHGDALVSYLVKSGAAPHEAHGVVNDLWADCLTPGADGPARIARWDGTCALRTWLNTVALNRLLTEKRREARWARIVPASLDALEPGGSSAEDSVEARMPVGATTHFEMTDAPLLELMRQAITAAFAQCPAEHFVLLQLAHGNGVRPEDLAIMWRCSPSSIRRILRGAGKDIARRTLENLRAADRWLEVRWSDFLDLCRSANPLHFGWL